ncbi:hypothetical protein D9M68_496400 [compost metagenome]
MPIKHIFQGIIVPASIFIPIFIFFFKYRITKIDSRLLFYYLVISGTINLIAIIFSQRSINNLPLLHLYTVVEAIFILSYFHCIFKQPLIKNALLMLIVLFPALCILNFSFLQSIYSFNTYTRPLEAILITFFCLFYLYKSGFKENWLKEPISWFNMGILIYFPVACVIFISSNYLIESTNKEMNTMVWNVHAALVLFMYLFWARGFKLIESGR